MGTLQPELRSPVMTRMKILTLHRLILIKRMTKGSLNLVPYITSVET
jgi:hypothetical protein